MSSDEETKVISVRLPKDLVDRFDDLTDNRTAVIRRMIESYVDGGGGSNGGDAVRRMRLLQLKHDLAAHEAQTELIESEIEELENQTNPADEAYFVELDSLLDSMEQTTKVDRELPRIKNLARERYGDHRLGQKVIDDLRDRADEQDRDIDDDHWREPEDRHMDGDPRERY